MIGIIQLLVILLIVIIFNLDVFENKDSQFVNEFINRGENLDITISVVTNLFKNIRVNIFDKLTFIDISSERKIHLLVNADKADNPNLAKYLLLI